MAISVQQVVYTLDLSGILGIRLPVIDVGPTAICEDWGKLNYLSYSGGFST